MKYFTRSFFIITSVAVIFAFGVYVGYAHGPVVDRITNVSSKEGPLPDTDADFSEFWKIWQLIDQKYPTAQKTTAQDRVYGSIKGLLSSLGDPYTTFFTPQENRDFQTEVSGAFEGVGLEIGIKDNILTVIAPIKNTPADIAGIKAGDQILKIDDTLTADMTTDAAVRLMRGKKGTSVNLTIARSGFAEPKVITVVRDTIHLPTVETIDVVNKNAYVIKLFTFTDQSPVLFESALQQFLDSGRKNLIIDLRNNPGGYLDAAVKIAGWFLPEGQVVVKEIGKDPVKDVVIDRSPGPNSIKNKTIYVLVNQGSASASEILAGALSEHNVATLIGERTFGKGSVQELIPLEGDTSVKITVAKWYTPNGVSISEKGLTPKILLKQDIKPTPSDPDPVLTQALALIK